jgi:hypothetical protein
VLGFLIVLIILTLQYIWMYTHIQSIIYKMVLVHNYKSTRCTKEILEWRVSADLLYWTIICLNLFLTGFLKDHFQIKPGTFSRVLQGILWHGIWIPLNLHILVHWFLKQNHYSSMLCNLHQRDPQFQEYRSNMGHMMGPNSQNEQNSGLTWMGCWVCIGTNWVARPMGFKTVWAKSY